MGYVIERIRNLILKLMGVEPSEECIKKGKEKMLKKVEEKYGGEK